MWYFVLMGGIPSIKWAMSRDAFCFDRADNLFEEQWNH